MDSTNGAALRSQMLYDVNRKSVGVAYLLWFFLGSFGGNRFHLGKTGSAVAQLALFLVGLVLTLALVGILILIPLAVWWIVDLFLIPGIAADHNVRLADSLIKPARGLGEQPTARFLHQPE